MKISRILFFVAAVALLAACNSNKAPRLDNAVDSVSWAAGEGFANAIIGSNLNLDNEVVIEAFVHTLRGGEQPLTDSAYEAMFIMLQQLSAQQAQQAQQQGAGAVESESSLFAEAMQKFPNAVPIEQGILIETLREGSGACAKFGERVTFDYKGYNMITGQVTDQTYGVREPVVHTVGSPMFEGLRISFTHMQAGGKYRIFVPSALAFGEKGTHNVPPHTPVVYEVELHKIN